MTDALAPSLVAHRGDCTAAPENSLAALESALRQGLPWVEFDVQLTRDRVPVLMHDASLARTTGVAREVFELTADEAQGLFLAGSRDARVPTLSAALALLDDHPGAGAFVEIKEESVRRFGVGPVLEAVLPPVAARAPRAVAISFSLACLEALAARGVTPRGWVLHGYDAASHARALELAPDYLFVDWRVLPESGPLWPGPWRWAVYEVESAEHALDLARRGASLLESRRAVELARDPRLGRGPQP